MFRRMRIWLPAVRAGSGTDVFTQRLAALLTGAGIDAFVSWLPHWAEFAPRLAAARPPRGVQLVHANSWNASAFAGVAPLVATVHHCVHDPAFARSQSWPQRLYHRTWIRPMERDALASAVAVTAVSESTRARTLAAFGPRPIDVVPLWVDTDRFAPRPPAPRHGAFRLLFAGNWNRRKGADVLPPLMRTLGPAFELTFTTGRRGAAPAAALPDNMRWAGRVEGEAGMIELYRACDAVVVPSRLEGFGYAALEAMACGKPVVAFDSSSLPEVVRRDLSGILVPPDDVAALAGACRRLAADSRLARSMGEAGRERAVAEFSGARALAGYRAVYERVLAR